MLFEEGKLCAVISEPRRVTAESESLLTARASPIAVSLDWSNSAAEDPSLEALIDAGGANALLSAKSLSSADHPLNQHALHCARLSEGAGAKLGA